jgi:hypothetical protein
VCAITAEFKICYTYWLHKLGRYFIWHAMTKMNKFQTFIFFNCSNLLEKGGAHLQCVCTVQTLCKVWINGYFWHKNKNSHPLNSLWWTIQQLKRAITAVTIYKSWYGYRKTWNIFRNSNLKCRSSVFDEVFRSSVFDEVF